MRLMEIDRRQTLLGLAAMGVSMTGVWATSLSGPQYFAASRRDGPGKYSAAIFDLEKGELTSIPLPARGHDIAARPASRECVVFARRPGNFAVSFDAEGRKPVVHFSSRPDRHFYGHGVFSHDGRRLFTTENDFENGRGVIGVRDATDGYRWLGEFSSGGIGPHDIALLSAGRVMVVANGGIRTHPESGRQVLNPDSLSPSLAYIDIETGETLETHSLAPALHKLSIRHLTIAANDMVVFGCQHKGPAWQRPALIGTHRRGEDIALIHLPKDTTRAMKNYVASIEVDIDGGIVMASAPRGGMAVAIDLASRRYLGKYSLPGVSGVAGSKSKSSFVLTTGNGKIVHYDPSLTGDRQMVVLSNDRGDQWDNHLLGF